MMIYVCSSGIQVFVDLCWIAVDMFGMLWLLSVTPRREKMDFDLRSDCASLLVRP